MANGALVDQLAGAQLAQAAQGAGSGQTAAPDPGLAQPTGGSTLDAVANRFTKAATSFTLGVPQIDLDRLELENRLIDEEVALAKQQRQQQAAQDAEETQLAGLFDIINSPQSTQDERDQAANRAAAIDPDLTGDFFEGIGVREDAEKVRIADRAARVAGQTDRAGQDTEIMRQIVEGEAAGRDMSDSKRLLSMSDQERGVAIALARTGALSPQERLAREDALTGGVGVPAEQATFEALIADFTPEDQAIARRIEAGLNPRAVGSGAITTATTEGLTDIVAESEATIASRERFATASAGQRADFIKTGVEQVQSISANIRNMDRAIAALDEGASTGAIESRFGTTLRESTIKLEAVQRELGLDIVGAVTFGALSEGELDLALTTALPTQLEPAALRQWLTDRKTAQGKLRDYYSDQIQFLNAAPENTIGAFITRQSGGGGDTGEIDPALLELMTPEERALFEQ